MATKQITKQHITSTTKVQPPNWKEAENKEKDTQKEQRTYVNSSRVTKRQWTWEIGNTKWEILLYLGESNHYLWVNKIEKCMNEQTQQTRAQVVL
jgi:hypothetical protein